MFPNDQQFKRHPICPSKRYRQIFATGLPRGAFFQIGLGCVMSHHPIEGLCTVLFKFWWENSKWCSCLHSPELVFNTEADTFLTTMMYMTSSLSPITWTWSKLLGSSLKAVKDILLFFNLTTPSGQREKNQCFYFVSNS